MKFSAKADFNPPGHKNKVLVKYKADYNNEYNVTSPPGVVCMPVFTAFWRP